MNYNRRGHHETNRSNTTAQSHYYQRTIPEMLAMRQESAVSTARPNKNVRFVEHSSEHAVAPNSPVMPSSNNPFYPPMHVATPAYETTPRQYGNHQYTYHHDATPTTPLQGKMYLDTIPAIPQRGDMYHDVVPSTPQRGQMYQEEVRPQRRQAYYEQQMPQRYQPPTPAPPVNQPYYGVPGFYDPNYGSSYAGDTPMSANDCEDPYTTTQETPHPRAATPRRALHAMSSAATPNTPDSARMALREQFTISTAGRKRTAAEAAPEMEVESVAANKQTRFTMESNSGPETKVRAARIAAPALHIFSGPVQRILKWESAREKFPMLFEVVAPLKSLRSTSTHQELLLRDEAGPVLQALFYEIDRRMPALQTGQLVRVVGRMISRARMQAFSVRAASDVERGSMQRISFVCHRAAAQIIAPSST